MTQNDSHFQAPNPEMTQNDSLCKASMPPMTQNDSHFEVSSFEMTQNDSFLGHKCPTEHPLSVADETPATPPSPQNDTRDGDPSVDGHSINAGPLPQAFCLSFLPAFADNQKTPTPCDRRMTHQQIDSPLCRDSRPLVDDRIAGIGYHTPCRSLFRWSPQRDR